MYWVRNVHRGKAIASKDKTNQFDGCDSNPRPSDRLRNQVFIQFAKVWRHHYGSKDLNPFRNKNTAYCR